MAECVHTVWLIQAHFTFAWRFSSPMTELCLEGHRQALSVELCGNLMYSRHLCNITLCPSKRLVNRRYTIRAHNVALSIAALY